MKIASGVITNYLYFVAVDATDLRTFETGFSSFTVYRSRNGAAEVAMTTPTIVEVDAANCPGLYALLVDEDTTIDAAAVNEELAFRITHAGMAPVTRTVTLSRELSVAQITNLGRYFGTMILVTVNTANSTRTNFETDLTESTDEHYNARWLLGLTGALAGQALPIVGYENTLGAIKVVNHTTDVPANGDTFLMVG